MNSILIDYAYLTTDYKQQKRRVNRSSHLLNTTKHLQILILPDHFILITHFNLEVVIVISSDFAVLLIEFEIVLLVHGHFSEYIISKKNQRGGYL